MNILAMTTECLVESTVDYGSKADGENSAFIEQLGIRVRVKEVQVMQGHGMLVLVLEFTASLTRMGRG